MTVRPMTVEDLRVVLDWAADEGWNPGLDDAAAFHAADPTGFLIKEVDNASVAAVSVVNHDTDFAFLGLYLCRPEFRGQGYGIEVWRAGIAHAGSRCIGLDGVPEQQANYAKSGFAKTGSTVRYNGHLDRVSDPRVQLATTRELQHLVSCDARASGMTRTAFSTTWLSYRPTRQTVVLVEGSDIKGFATFRQCGLGCKIGPLYASSEVDALALLGAHPVAASSDPLFVDVPGHDTALAVLLKQHGFEPVFETARMFTGIPPASAPWAFQAIATMELG
ncbi:N-acetyltransferase [Roseobacter sp. YSTF-M11]|uniref:N-acetyltransferase n=1 Tax=Roseobacter insulae TaxID=2859783 RepID=A0A9X1K2P5_9RHOB|nr:GNAT family N-acetyltransferase [Roseobacter insulae]MBW4708748.1 N-acetyltransferase [Roseobacter insulae]